MTHRDDERPTATAPPATGWPRITGLLDERLTRLGITGRFGRDCMLALTLTIVTIPLMALVLNQLSQSGDLESEVELTTTQSGWILAFAALQTMALCLRRVRPYLCLAAIVGCQIAVMAPVPDLSTRTVAPIITMYTVATLMPIRATAVAAISALLVEGIASVALAAQQPDPLPVVASQLGSGAVSYLTGALIGSYVATRRAYLRMERAQAAEAVRAQQARLRAAIATERSHIARELHDVAAHHLSSMVVQAAAVERLVDRDPPAARAGAAWLRRQGKETLENLRQVVGLLRDRDGPDRDGNTPLPGLAALDDLVRTARDLGTQVALRRIGVPLELPPIADVSLYRVAQQALTNARQHAPGAPVRIRLEYSDRDVVLDIVNDGSPRRPEADGLSAGGTGLAGMRERVELVGAQLVTGPTDEAGWRVHLRLPVHQAPPGGRVGGDFPEEVPLRDQGAAG